MAKVIEDAEWSFRTAEGDETYAVKYSDLFALIKAAKAYLEASEGGYLDDINVADMESSS